MIYWIFLLGIILVNFKYKKDGVFYLWKGFYLFCAGSFISIIGLTSTAEFFMRVSISLLIFGFILIVKKQIESV